MNLPNQLTEREAIDPKLAVGSSLPNPKGLLAIVLALYLVNDEKDSLDYSDKSGNTIILKPSLITLLKTLFNGITGYSVTEIDSLASANPLVKMQVEPLQVPLQLFWKIAKINILGTDSSSGERTGGVRFTKELLFTTNMDILKNVISDENENVTNIGKELIYSWLTNKVTPSTSIKIEQKLSKTLSVFSEETLFKTWNNTEEIIFQQEGVYNSLDATNTVVDLNGTKEIKGTLRNLKSSIGKDMHPYLKITGNNVELKNSSLANSFENYQKRVSHYLDLNPKSIEIKTVEAEDDIILDDVEILNKIYYGAPGTGKSHKVKQIVQNKEERTERITFHPEYDYNSFVGGYKPTMDGDNIRYEFVPQAFTNIYTKAWNDLDNDYFLVIEEINRGNCAEIFGDIFQLLDRTNDYKITPSKELKEYLEIELKDNPDIDSDKLLLPPNLNILATMNTSDQSLFPMDSAFKRRWDWEYIPINYEATYINYKGEEKENESANYLITLPDDTSFKWLDFIKSVNNNWIRKNENLGMDKCLGNYFIKSETKEITLNIFINKAVFYLWNDVFKDEMEEKNIFKDKTTYEDFFPIETDGLSKVKEILGILEVEVKPT